MCMSEGKAVLPIPERAALPAAGMAAEARARIIIITLPITMAEAAVMVLMEQAVTAAPRRDRAVLDRVIRTCAVVMVLP